MENYFKELNISALSGKTIILDIDGTITMDRSSDIDPLVLIKIKEMNLSNNVFLFSNSKLPDRNRILAEKLQVSLLESSFKKPSRRVIDGLPNQLKSNITIIGDKVLTDGIFAKNIQADFIKIKHLQGENDSLKIKIIYILDNIFSYLFI